MHNSYNSDIVIFGGHGDLAFRKLMPALYHIFTDADFEFTGRVISVSRDTVTKQEHITLVQQKMKEFLPESEYDEEKIEKFKSVLEVTAIDFETPESYKGLQELLKSHPDHDRIYYLSTASEFFAPITKALDTFKLIIPNSRVVLEKPIGRDFESSQAINSQVLKYFKEHQIFRIDHYLGKETVQNIMALRFSNRMFMPLWSASHIDHVQITVAEDVGVEGRWGYYDQYGAMRDMIQNHLMQLLCLIAMEPPCSLAADSVRDEKVKIIRSLRPMTLHDVANKTVRAQYDKGSIEGVSVPGYREGEGVENSTTETYAALRIDIDNWRWGGVPFYVRSGKRLKERNSEIIIKFKDVPHSIFPDSKHTIEQNTLVISLQPKESITLKMMNKVAGLNEVMNLKPVELELNDTPTLHRKHLAYERLLLDVIRNNPTHFMRLDEVEAAWKWSDIILKAWQENVVAMKSYTAGSDGPSAAIALIERDARSWHE